MRLSPFAASLLVLAAFLVPVAVAQTESGSGSVTAFLLTSIFVGVLGGVGYVFLGIFSAYAKDPNSTSGTKGFLYAVGENTILGVIVGALFGLLELAGIVAYLPAGLDGITILQLLFANFPVLGGIYALRKAVGIYTGLKDRRTEIASGSS